VYDSMVVSFCLELGTVHQRSVIFLNNNNYRPTVVSIGPGYLANCFSLTLYVFR